MINKPQKKSSNLSGDIHDQTLPSSAPVILGHGEALTDGSTGDSPGLIEVAWEKFGQVGMGGFTTLLYGR